MTKVYKDKNRLEAPRNVSKLIKLWRKRSLKSHLFRGSRFPLAELAVARSLVVFTSNKSSFELVREEVYPIYPIT